ncbi:MAG: biopolymer transporter ExbD [Planctomycetales bacterium]
MKIEYDDSEGEGPNLTPVIDVVFLLLIFFLVATRFDQEEKELDVVVPEVAQAQPLTKPPDEIVINVMKDGSYKVLGKTLSEDQLAGMLSQAYMKNQSNQAVLIRGDGASELQYSVRVMGLCNKARITEYRVAAIQPE